MVKSMKIAAVFATVLVFSGGMYFYNKVQNAKFLAYEESIRTALSTLDNVFETGEIKCFSINSQFEEKCVINNLKMNFYNENNRMNEELHFSKIEIYSPVEAYEQLEILKDGKLPKNNSVSKVEFAIDSINGKNISAKLFPDISSDEKKEFKFTLECTIEPVGNSANVLSKLNFNLSDKIEFDLSTDFSLLNETFTLLGEDESLLDDEDAIKLKMKILEGAILKSASFDVDFKEINPIKYMFTDNIMKYNTNQSEEQVIEGFKKMFLSQIEPKIGNEKLRKMVEKKISTLADGEDTKLSVSLANKDNSTLRAMLSKYGAMFVTKTIPENLDGVVVEIK